MSDAAAHETVDRAYEVGLRFFDTAPLYRHGLAARRLGRALTSRPRDDFVIATKVGRLLRRDVLLGYDTLFRGIPPVNPVFDFGYDGVLRSVDESLGYLSIAIPGELWADLRNERLLPEDAFVP